eukprot:571203-Pyramimonas_sp.AAC.2
MRALTRRATWAARSESAAVNTTTRGHLGRCMQGAPSICNVINQSVHTGRPRGICAVFSPSCAQRTAPRRTSLFLKQKTNRRVWKEAICHAGAVQVVGPHRMFRLGSGTFWRNPVSLQVVAGCGGQNAISADNQTYEQLTLEAALRLGMVSSCRIRAAVINVCVH